MPPILHLVRHAQAQHNVHVNNHYLIDPCLTDLGKGQCSQLKTSFPKTEHIDLIVASPLKRTIQTALIAFEDVLRDNNLRVLCLPELQETSNLPCDTGSSREVLEKEFGDQPVNLDHVTPNWECKVGRWAPDVEAVQTRARQVRVWLRDRPERNIVVVTHGGFLHFFTENWSEHDLFSGTGWANTEWRSVRFTSEEKGPPTSTDNAEDAKQDMAHVEELPESQERRRHEAQIREAAEREHKKTTDAHVDAEGCDTAERVNDDISRSHGSTSAPSQIEVGATA
ncbi:putative phosphatase [Cercospora beticola]|uniref:Putative phosphatase n=1 Tax=Cercospora beticola TaxID=122368 RepID=A0A2G5IA63_CERBT|nr:putative phosphatase [Cercospora beticola]PIB01650.1 putative phosphatase [Cercospora beticola]WPA96562.1 hypothetical protein RHO25_001169 [Cercospora beticola]